jgi:hypothetical protein
MQQEYDLIGEPVHDLDLPPTVVSGGDVDGHSTPLSVLARSETHPTLHLDV